VSVVAWWLLRHPSARSEGQVFPLFLALFPTRVGRLILLELGMVRGGMPCIEFFSDPLEYQIHHYVKIIVDP
jgi:hypothetical protein